MNNFYCEFQDLVSSWLIQINDFFLKFVFSDVINFILKIKYTKNENIPLGLFQEKKTEKTYENQRLTIAQSLVIGHYNYFL